MRFVSSSASAASPTPAPVSASPSSAPINAQPSSNAATQTATDQQSNSSSDGGNNSSSSGNAADSSAVDLNADPLGSDRGIAYWLYGCAGLVFVMVSVGGLTRLTKSGLSMVEWKPTTIVPPTTHEEWMIEFEKYQQFPEYKRVNNQMSLQDFQFIYRMEFYHRLLGRMIGVAFAIPSVYFLARGRINRPLGARLALAFMAGGAQGGVGWWMVQSGLDHPHQNDHSASVHVSPYRLATHLISAFAIYSLLLATAMRVHPSTFKTRVLPSSTGAQALSQFYASAPVRHLRTLGIATTAVVGLTVFSGAFVAGNEAGLVYNEFPWMGGVGRLIPQDIIHPYLQPKWRNLFENSTTVQFDHRVLAMTTTALAIGTFLLMRRVKNDSTIRTLMSQHTCVAERVVRLSISTHALLGMVTIQVSLGIATLLLYVPTPLAAVHQAGSLTLLSIALWLMHCLRRPAAAVKITKTLEQAIKNNKNISTTIKNTTH